MASHAREFHYNFDHSKPAVVGFCYDVHWVWKGGVMPMNALGMKLGIHHHMPEMASHAREFHYNFDHSKPAVVGFCYDVHWVWKGGVMPLDALNQYGDRVVTWHLRQSRDGVWWEDLDTGDVDYQAVAKYAREHKLPRRFTVELAIEGGTKITRSVVENHRRSREFVRTVFGG